MKNIFSFTFFCALALLLLAQVAFANDSAASKSSGGIVLTREARISMEKERLIINLNKITVEYEFLNDTDSDITTEVAFPIPPYSTAEYESAAGMRMFDDFHVWVEGKEISFQTEAKAVLDKNDVTGLLNSYGVDVATIGHFNPDHISEDIQKLPKQKQSELKRRGIEIDSGWEVHKTYHWQQTFPAHTRLHVRHEYSPAVGFTPVESKIFDSTAHENGKSENESEDDIYPDFREVTRSCIEPALQKAIAARAKRSAAYEKGYVYTSWVNYILTTANTWKTPIKKFELIVGKEAPRYLNKPTIVSFCWDGPVIKLDSEHYKATAKDFVPKHNLHILFLSAP